MVNTFESALLLFWLWINCCWPSQIVITKTLSANAHIWQCYRLAHGFYMYCPLQLVMTNLNGKYPHTPSQHSLFFWALNYLLDITYFSCLYNPSIFFTTQSLQLYSVELILFVGLEFMFHDGETKELQTRDRHSGLRNVLNQGMFGRHCISLSTVS